MYFICEKRRGREGMGREGRGREGILKLPTKTPTYVVVV